MNKIGFGTKVSCKLIGWNPELLSNCTEASFRTLKRYTSALLILIILWFFVASMFVRLYLDASWLLSSIVGLIMSGVVVCIERQIILKPMGGRYVWLTLTRFALAVCMALIGSTIIDQFLFQDDIEMKMKPIADKRANEAMAERAKIYKEEEIIVTKEIDSLLSVNDSLNRLIEKNPQQKITSLNKSTEIRKIDGNPVIDSVTGKPVIDVTYATITTTVPNANIAVRDKNQERIETLWRSLEEIKDKKEIELKQLQEFYAEKKGFLDELDAILIVVKDGGGIAITIYLLFFVFFGALEIIILVSSGHECDYDELVKLKLESRKDELKKQFQNRKISISEDHIDTGFIS